MGFDISEILCIPSLYTHINPIPFQFGTNNFFLLNKLVVNHDIHS